MEHDWNFGKTGMIRLSLKLLVCIRDGSSLEDLIPGGVNELQFSITRELRRIKSIPFSPAK